MAVTTLLWHLWPGRHWPLTATEEAVFVADLTRRAGPATSRPAATRGDVTAVLNALRCGLSVDEMLEAAPGLRPSRLLVAYQDLGSRLLASTAAWAAIADHPTIATLTEHAPGAALLLPVVTHRLAACGARCSPAVLRQAIADAAAEVATVGATAAALEQRLTTLSSDTSAARMALELYNPYGAGLWDHPFYLPTRVGTLVPVRVRELLGERRP